MKKIILSLIIIISVISLSACIQKEDKQSNQVLPYEEEPAKHYVEEPIVIDINEQIDQYIKQMSVEEKIGQLLMPAFRNFNYPDSVEVLTESIEKVITDYKVGGVILFKENIITKEQTQTLIHDLQEKSKIPLWIGVDEEGGIVSRIASNPDMGFETISTAFEIGETANKELAYNTGSQLGAMLTELGFNMNFAPVADVWSNPDNKVIGKRSFGNDPHKVSEMVNEVAIAPKTDVMLANVSGDGAAIGYISLGSLNDSIKPIKIDSIEPTAEKIKSGEYKLARPFNIATKAEPTGLAKDFIDYILSAQGQEVVASSYIPVTDNAPQYTPNKIEGKIVVAGSSSVTPVMESLKEAYELINPGAEIEIQLSDSTSGMNSTMEGICDIGMASRPLKDSEKAVLNSMEIAIDGIVVITNKTNGIENLSTDNVKDIFTGEITKWDEIK